MRAAARLLAVLPPRAVRVLAGRRVRIDGQELDAASQLFARVDRLVKKGDWADLGPDEVRRLTVRDAAAVGFAAEAMDHVSTVAIPGQRPARLYVPIGAVSPGSLLVYYHGGAHVFGDPDVHDAPCRLLAAHSGARVLSTDYRLAPEHPFPAAVDDALAAFTWAAANAGELGADPSRVAVGGDSAGGNLAAAVALVARDAGGPQPAFQLLIYPVLDMVGTTRSRELFGDGFYLTSRDIAWARGCYVPDDASRRDPRASPLLAADVAGLPPAYVVTAGFDPLRDEGEAYARRLREAGVPVTLRREDRLLHGFVNMTAISAAAHAATLEIAAALRAGLGGDPA
jgi:acetyl esterase